MSRKQSTPPPAADRKPDPPPAPPAKADTRQQMSEFVAEWEGMARRIEDAVRLLVDIHGVLSACVVALTPDDPAAVEAFAQATELVRLRVPEDR